MVQKRYRTPTPKRPTVRSCSPSSLNARKSASTDSSDVRRTLSPPPIVSLTPSGEGDQDGLHTRRAPLELSHEGDGLKSVVRLERHDQRTPDSW